MKFYTAFFFILIFFSVHSCNKDDDAFVAPVEFGQIGSIEGIRLWQATGFVGSENLNSLFIVSREPNPANGINSERILQFNLATQEKKISYFDQIDFISKNAHIINDELIIIGGSFINTYSTSLDSAPISLEHGLSLSRSGSVVYKNDIYIWGGDLNKVESNLIKRWNSVGQKFETIATLPAPSTWSSGEVINDKLYIFGGQREFEDTPATDVVYIYDFNQSSFSTSRLPSPMSRTFTAKHNDLIFVIGHKESDGTSVFLQFDTSILKFKELPFSVDVTMDPMNNIHQLTVMNNTLYILYGKGEELEELFLMEAKIN